LKLDENGKWTLTNETNRAEVGPNITQNLTQH